MKWTMISKRSLWSRGAWERYAPSVKIGPERKFVFKNEWAAEHILTEMPQSKPFSPPWFIALLLGYRILDFDMILGKVLFFSMIFSTSNRWCFVRAKVSSQHNLTPPAMGALGFVCVISYCFSSSENIDVPVFLTALLNNSHCVQQ